MAAAALVGTTVGARIVNYAMTTPCDNCPFRKEGGIRLREGRVLGLTDPRSGEFACHKTTVEDEDGDRRQTEDSSHCAGALIFHEKQGQSTQMMRICERIGMYDHTKLRGQDLVFDDVAEMLEASVDARKPKRKKKGARR